MVAVAVASVRRAIHEVTVEHETVRVTNMVFLPAVVGTTEYLQAAVTMAEQVEEAVVLLTVLLGTLVEVGPRVETGRLLGL